MAVNFAKKGGTWPSALTGADEAAVSTFLDHKIKFTEIQSIIKEAIKDHNSIESPSPSDMLKASDWGSKRVFDLAGGN